MFHILSFVTRSSFFVGQVLLLLSHLLWVFAVISAGPRFILLAVRKFIRSFCASSSFFRISLDCLVLISIIPYSFPNLSILLLLAFRSFIYTAYSRFLFLRVIDYLIFMWFLKVRQCFSLFVTRFALLGCFHCAGSTVGFLRKWLSLSFLVLRVV